MKKRIKAVIDTNVFIKYLIDGDENCNSIFELYDNQKMKLYFSQDTIGELMLLIKIATLKSNFNNEVSLALLNTITTIFYFSKTVNTKDTECPTIKDNTDEMFLKTAIEGKVDYLISNDVASGMHDVKNYSFKVMKSDDFVEHYFDSEDNVAVGKV